METQPSEMSFALSMDGGRLEWGSHDLDTIFAQRSNLASPAFLAMMRDVVRFGRQAPEVLRPENEAEFAGMTLGQYLRLRRYSTAFTKYYVAPMCAAVWSVPNAQVRWRMVVRQRQGVDLPAPHSRNVALGHACR